MRKHIGSFVVAALFTAFTLTTQPFAQADTFGSGANTFDIDFVDIGNAGNVADTTGYGAVSYGFRMGVFEISQDQIDKATAGGLSNVAAGAWSGNQPAANISWFEAAAFVNWLNVSTGNQAAYNLTWNGAAWSMSLWSSADAWSVGGQNLFRHKAAFYFLPSENEWYKAGHYDPNKGGGLGGYWLYPTGSDTAPARVAGGTDPNTAIYSDRDSEGNFLPPVLDGPADAQQAGGLSAYGTMGQGGNLYDWIESAFDGINDDPYEGRPGRGGDLSNHANGLSAGNRGGSPAPPDFELGWNIGFRVASVPEPSTYALLIMTGAGAFWWSRRKQ
jgi:formylglycine-generating enzyme required for sulfatase activity